MKNVLDDDLSVGFVVSHPFYGSPGSIIRIRELSISLTKLGGIIHIFSPYSQEEFWGKNIFFHQISSSSSTLGIQHIAYNITRKILNNPFFIRRIILNRKILNMNINRFAKSLLTAINDDEITVIQGEQEIAAAACVRLRDKLNIPIVASLHNIWPEELVASGLIEKKSKEYAVLQELEQEIVTGADHIVVVSKEMARYLEDRYSIASGRISVVPPGGRAKVSKVNDQTPPFKVVYAGLVDSRANLDLFIESMPLVMKKYKNVKFFITDRGEEIKRIRKLALKLDVYPTYYWFPESNIFYKFLASCHIGIVTSSNDLPRRLGPAVKLFDYLSVGLPVVANDIGGWTKIIEREKLGVLTENDPESFSDGILKLLNNMKLSKSFGEHGLELVKKKYNWDNSARTLIQKYSEIIGRN